MLALVLFAAFCKFALKTNDADRAAPSKKVQQLEDNQPAQLKPPVVKHYHS